MPRTCTTRLIRGLARGWRIGSFRWRRAQVGQVSRSARIEVVVGVPRLPAGSSRDWRRARGVWPRRGRVAGSESRKRRPACPTAGIAHTRPADSPESSPRGSCRSSRRAPGGAWRRHARRLAGGRDGFGIPERRPDRRSDGIEHPYRVGSHESSQRGSSNRQSWRGPGRIGMLIRATPGPRFYERRRLRGTHVLALGSASGGPCHNRGFR